METNPSLPVTPDEARSSLDEIDRIGRQMRRAIAAGCTAPMLILWGAIWIVGFGTEQFIPHAYRLWLVLDLAGLAGSFLLGGWSRKASVKGSGRGRIGLSWLILFGYAILWSALFYRVHGAYGPFFERRLAVYWVTVCMFAYVVMGLWLDRFLLWLGVLVTISTLVGLAFAPHYLFLWIAVTGGGSLTGTGVFIRKFWK